MRKLRALWVLLSIGLLVFTAPAGAADGDLPFEATIEGRPLADVDANEPLELRSGEIEVTIRVRNEGADAVDIRYLRFSGQATGIDFFSYITRVDMALDVGDEAERVYLLDVGDLGDLATGLLPAELSLLDADRSVLSDEGFIVDVRGSLGSVYGIFGLAVVVGTGLLLSFVLFRLFTNRLPVNRWRRATYFSAPGFGVGLTITFGVSVLRLVSPTTSVWLVLLLVGGGAGLGLGYLTPTPYDELDEPDDLDELRRLERREGIAESVWAEQGRQRSPTGQPETDSSPFAAEAMPALDASSISEIARALPGYEIGAELGRGGMGVVLSGRHRQLGRNVAIKELPPQLASDPDVRSRFVAEARVLASLDHPHIVPIYDFVERDGLCLLVMETLPGGTVWGRYTSDGLTNEQSCAIAMLACAGLAYAHSRGVLHRDVKPENLLFSSEGMLKITDFGIAKVINGGETFATTAGDILGTPAYISPEQAEGKELGPAADVYATGVMLYELLAGTLPYSDEGGAFAVVFRHVYEDPRPLTQVAPDVPVALADVVMQAIARDPAHRTPTAEDFGVAIGQAATRAWGPGWIDLVGMPIAISGRILASADRLTAGEPVGRAPSAPTAKGDDPRATLTRPGPPTSPDGGPPPPLPAVVRPSAVDHAGGARPADLRPEDLVPVRDLLTSPPSPTVPALVTIALLATTALLAVIGLGGAATTLEPGQAQVAGVDPAVAAVPVDFDKDIAVRMQELPAGAENASRARLDYSVAGVALPSSATRDLEQIDGGVGADLATSASRHLAVGRILADLVLLDPQGAELSSSRFAVEPEAGALTTVPGVATIMLLVLVLAYGETFLRPMRRKAQRKVSGLIGMLIVGAGFGVSLVLLAWAFLSIELTTTSLVACAGAGSLTGVTLGLAVARFGRRRRVMRLARALELRKSARLPV